METGSALDNIRFSSNRVRGSFSPSSPHNTTACGFALGVSQSLSGSALAGIMNHLRSLKTASFLIAFILTLPILVIAGQYKVIRVVDGDTIVVDYQGKHEKVRLLCVNTPESVHPDKKQNIPMGKVASNYAKKKLGGKYVEIEIKVGSIIVRVR